MEARKRALLAAETKLECRPEGCPSQMIKHSKDIMLRNVIPRIDPQTFNKKLLTLQPVRHKWLELTDLAKLQYLATNAQYVKTIWWDTLVSENRFRQENSIAD